MCISSKSILVLQFSILLFKQERLKVMSIKLINFVLEFSHILRALSKIDSKVGRLACGAKQYTPI